VTYVSRVIIVVMSVMCEPFYALCHFNSHGPYIWTCTMYRHSMYVFSVMCWLLIFGNEMCWISVTILSIFSKNYVKFLSKLGQNWIKITNEIRTEDSTQVTLYEISHWWVLPFLQFSIHVLQVQKAHWSPTLYNSIQIDACYKYTNK
jgi:hypothetical protein